MYTIIQAKFQNSVHRMFIVPATEIPLIFCLFFGITGTGRSAIFMSQIIRYGDFKLWTEYSKGSFLFGFNPTVTQDERLFFLPASRLLLVVPEFEENIWRADTLIFSTVGRNTWRFSKRTLHVKIQREFSFS